MLMEQPGQQGVAGRGRAAPDLGELGEGGQELTGHLEEALVVHRGEPGHQERVLPNHLTGGPALLDVVDEGQPEGRERGQEDEPDEARPTTEEGRAWHLEAPVRGASFSYSRR